MNSKLFTFALVLAVTTAAQADVYLTMSNGDWGTVDVSTATFTTLGTSSINMGDAAIDPTNGQGWGIGNDGNLQKIDISNGDSTMVATSLYTNNMGVLTDGSLIMATGRQLVKVNKTDGSFTDYGLYSDEIIFDLTRRSDGMIFGTDSDNMYVRDESDMANLATFLGDTGFGDIFGLAFQGGTLYGYGIDNATAVQFEIDQVTGAGFNVKALQGTGANYVLGAAEYGAVPEPFTLGILCPLALVALKRKRK